MSEFHFVVGATLIFVAIYIHNIASNLRILIAKIQELLDLLRAHR